MIGGTKAGLSSAKKGASVRHSKLAFLNPRRCSMDDTPERTAGTESINMESTPLEETYVTPMPEPLPTPARPPETVQPGAYPRCPGGQETCYRDIDLRSITIGDSLRAIVLEEPATCVDNQTEGELAELQTQRLKQSLAMAQMRQRLLEMEDLRRELDQLKGIPLVEPVPCHITTATTSPSSKRRKRKLSKNHILVGQSVVVRPKDMSDEEWDVYQILIGYKQLDVDLPRPTRPTRGFSRNGKPRFRLPNLKRPVFGLPFSNKKKIR